MLALPLEGKAMTRFVFSTTAAVLLLATSVYAQEPPPLRAAVDGTFAPHAFPNLSGGYQGFNVDLANEIAARLRRKIVIDAAQFSGLVPAMQAGTYDFLAAPTTVTKERAESMLFTEGYLNTDFQFLIKKGSPKVVKLEDLKGKTVVAQANTNNLEQITALNTAQNLGINILVVNYFREGLPMVETGRATAFVMDDILLSSLAASSKSPRDMRPRSARIRPAPRSSC